MIRFHGTTPGGREKRVLDISKVTDESGEPGVAVWIHSGNRDNGWQINFSRDQIVNLIDFILISDRW